LDEFPEKNIILFFCLSKEFVGESRRRSVVNLFNRRISVAFMVCKKRDVVFVLLYWVFKTSLSDELLSESPGSPQPVIPTDRGVPEEARTEKTPQKNRRANEAVQPSRSWGSRLRGKDEKARLCFGSNAKKLIKKHPQILSKNPDNSPALQRWVRIGSPLFFHFPEGRLSVFFAAFQPSLRDEIVYGRLPTVETVGYLSDRPSGTEHGHTKKNNIENHTEDSFWQGALYVASWSMPPFCEWLKARSGKAESAG
jgi:hypothetical protein